MLEVVALSPRAFSAIWYLKGVLVIRDDVSGALRRLPAAQQEHPVGCHEPLCHVCEPMPPLHIQDLCFGQRKVFHEENLRDRFTKDLVGFGKL